MSPILIRRLDDFCERNLLANVADRDIDLDGPGRRYERAWDDRRALEHGE
jgi:hypothetical protein